MGAGTLGDNPSYRRDVSVPDLVRVINAWPRLSEPIKAAIRALIQAPE